jgi:hypothetical protein
MKKIVRLTENDLARIVKRVINEQNEDAYKILSQMETLCNNGYAESESMKNTVYKIKDKATYDTIQKLVYSGPKFKASQGKNYALIADWLKAEGVSPVAYASGDGDDIMTGISNAVRTSGVGDAIGKHLGKFNIKELKSLTYGTQTF